MEKKCTECGNELHIGHIEHDRKPFCSHKCILIYNCKDEKERIDWNIIEEQKKLNKQPRINWKAILGMSLTRAIARFKAAGLSTDLTYKTICYEHPELTDEMKRKLKIGIAARFGEMGTAQSELSKRKGK